MITREQICYNGVLKHQETLNSVISYVSTTEKMFKHELANLVITI